jgi:hypothetical protein
MFKLGFDLKIDVVKYRQNDTLFSDEIKNNNV